jgi:hypothetical protein
MGRTSILGTVMTKRDLCRAEDEGWAELHALIGSLTSQQLEEPGYIPEGWSVKDLMAHLASWMAESGMVLEQIRWGTFRADQVPWGTYRSKRLDIDEMNRRFYEANRDVPLSVVRAQLASSRNRMLVLFDDLPQVTPDAEEWFREAGPMHYGEHVPRLREWVEELSRG